jgi:hypothetical protein
MDIPSSMKDLLSQWNDGAGIDLETWVACEGRFALAAGYSTLYWPDFVKFDRYVLRKEFSEAALRSFENSPGATRQSVETVMNHLHIADIQHADCEDGSADKIVFIGRRLKEIYQAKLCWLFPDHPCEVEMWEPEDKDDLQGYQLSFWQKPHR